MKLSNRNRNVARNITTVHAATLDVRLLRGQGYLLAALSLGLALLSSIVGARPAAAAPLQRGICPAIGGLPVYAPATCLTHKEEQDDGVLERKNEYVTSHAADTVRRFFERAFAPNGWTLAGTQHDVADGECEYLLIQCRRSLELKVEQKWGTTGAFTKITLAD